MLTAPSQGLNEVDVAYIRAARGSRIVVSAASTGATHKLTSWRWRIEADGAPVHLSDTYSQVGGDVKDHALLPNQSSGAHPRLFLSAARRGGQLWPSTWTMNTDGQMTALDSRAYGDVGRVGR